MTNHDPAQGVFPTTQWTLVEQLHHGDETTALKALERVLEIYQLPLRLYLIRQFNVTADQAAEWLQSYVWKKVIVKKLLAQADRKKGKFRTFLASTLANFVVSEIRRQNARPQLLDQPAEQTNPDAEEELPPAQYQQFNVSWGQGIMAETFRRMRLECKERDIPHVWIVFEARLLEPTLQGAKPLPYNELYQKLGFKSQAEAGNTLMTAKRMFARVLRLVIREYARDEAEVEAEIRELMNAFREI